MHVGAFASNVNIVHVIIVTNTKALLLNVTNNVCLGKKLTKIKSLVPLF